MYRLIVTILFFLAASPLLEALEKEKLTEYLNQLVSFKSITSDKEENLKALEWVEKKLSKLDLHFNFHEFNGHHALVITTQKTKQPKVWLVAHIDVVPAEEEMFKPKIDGEKYSARGAYDMKMAIACYVLLMEELKDTLGEYDLGIMLTSDEEIGGMNGVKRLLEAGYSGQVALLPDGGFDWNFEVAAKGVLQVKVLSHGRSAHSSRPWTGENAISKLMQLLQAIDSYFEQEMPKHGSYFPTANVGQIMGGKGVNQVPDYAEAKIDIRFPPSMRAEEIYSRLQEKVKQFKGAQLEKIIEAQANKADVNHPYFQKFRQIAKELHGIEIGEALSHGSSDARFFGEKNIPVLVITSRGGDIHSDLEWLDLEDLTRFYEVMKRWVLEISRK